MLMDQKTQHSINSICTDYSMSLNEIPNKISAGFVVDMDKVTLKFIWKGQRTRMAKTCFKGKNKVGRNSTQS